MKRMAILAASVCIVGNAWAADSVHLYGVIDMGVAHFSGGAFGSTTMLASGYQASNRIGMRGSEDLGSGMNAYFQVETGFCGNGSPQAGNMNIGVPITSAKAGSAGYCTGGGFFQRTSYVGLRGDFGSIQAGRLYTQSFFVAGGADPFGAWVQNILFPVPYFRFSQAIQYATPNLGGFSAVGQYAFGGYPGSMSPGSAFDVALRYHSGPAGLGVGYFDAKPLATTSTPAVPVAGDNKFVQLSGSYDFNVVKVIGYWSKMTSANGLSINTGQPSKNAHIWALAVVAPLHIGKLMASYSAFDDTDNSARNAKQYTVGYTYPFSKRTNLYASYAHISNNAEQTFAVADATDFGFAPNPGNSSSGFAVGIKHAF